MRDGIKNNTNSVLLGISVMPDHSFLQACLPLFENESIDVIEWSFDTILDPSKKPDWLHLLLNEYAENGRLLGHGVYYSLFDAQWTERQSKWLQQVKKEVSTYPYQHLTEHFGLMSSTNAHEGFPLPVPLTDSVLQIGIDRLKRLQNAAQIPIGIENLALAFHSDEVKAQGDFIYRMIEPVNGFIILDLHNLYCQAANFNIDLMELINAYSLDCVKELHISGGSWDEDPTLTKRIRRDTHDQNVPSILFDILPAVIQKCPHLEYVIFEQLSTSLQTENEINTFRNDYGKLKRIIEQTNAQNEIKTWGNDSIPNEEPISNSILFAEQELLRSALIQNTTNKDFQSYSPPLNQKWNEDLWKTAIKLTKQWNRSST